MPGTKHFRVLLMITVLGGIISPSTALATNGMNLEGFGPIATGLGGASLAFDNGTAALMNNPATLALMPSGSSRLDLALTTFMPDITVTTSGVTDKMTKGAYYMPAIGWATRLGSFSYGIGFFAQGGMGTEYDGNAHLAYGSGEPVRSELGVGRLMFPLVYEPSPEIAVGVTLEYVRATLDLKMAATGSKLGSLVTRCAGSSCGLLPALSAAPWTRIDFSDNNQFNGAAEGDGFAAKMGMIYKVNPSLTLGAVYQRKTNLDDLETGDSDAQLRAAGGFTDAGKMTVRDFQWPETYGIGAAWQASDRSTVVADVKRLKWKSVMRNFQMTYESPSFTIDMALPQNWEDQTVASIGFAHQANNALTLRAGINHSTNPIPPRDTHPLFPATIEKHVTFGAGYAFSKASSLDVAAVFAPAVKVTNSDGNEIEHGQFNWQIMFSRRF